MTNAERIRNLSEEKLAEELIDRIDFYCSVNPQEEMWVGDFWGIRHTKYNAIKAELEWLKSEVKE